MITNIDDINKALENIRTENTIYPLAMSDKMDATAYNIAFNRIERQLNQLYEKIRLVEDIDNFCREYILREIELKEEKLRESLKIAEDVSDLYQKKDSISILVPFVGTNEIIKDRDGSPVCSMSIKNKKLEVNNDVMSEEIFSSITFTSNSSCYNNSYHNLLDGRSGSSFYSVKEPLPEGIKETVTMNLASSSECNYLSIQPVNCEVSNVRILDKNRVPRVVSSNGYFPRMEIVGIVFDVIAKNFTREAKYGDTIGYDNSGAFGMLDTAYTRWQNEQIVKQMEISQAEADKKYMISELETKCDTWNKINANMKRRNILLAGEKNGN